MNKHEIKFMFSSPLTRRARFLAGGDFASHLCVSLENTRSYSLEVSIKTKLGN